MKKQELVVLIEQLKKIFDIVRLVDVSMTKQYLLDEHGDFIEQPYECYTVWHRNQRCGNCISAKAFIKKCRLTKFEINGDEVYHVIAKYVELQERPFVLEMVSKITDEALFSAYGESEFARTISFYNKQIYKDPLTDVYNRRYFEEQLKGVAGLNALAMVDLDDFKAINDTFGHQAGDEALCKAAEVISSALDEDAHIIRYGGDEFLLIFHKISNENYVKKLENIRSLIQKVTLPDYPQVHLTISIGGVYCEHYHNQAIQEADQMLYQAKKKKNMVQIKTEHNV